MISSRPVNVPPQMNRMCEVSIWMYCCSGCLRPPWGGTLAVVPSSIFKQGLLHAFARHVAGDRDVLARLADLVDLVDVDDAALGRFDVEVGGVEQLQEQVLDVLADVAGFGQRRGVADGERHVEACGPACGPSSVLPQPVGPTSRMFDLSISTSESSSAVHQPLVVAVHGDGQHALGRFLADHVFVELGDDLARRGDAGEELLARAAALALLVENRLAELDALAADVDVARSFDQRSDVAIALATERTEGVLLGGAAAACAADVPTVGIEITPSRLAPLVRVGRSLSPVIS